MPINDPFYTSLELALKSCTLQNVTVTEEGTLQTVPFYEKVLRWLNPKRHDVAEICRLFAEKLSPLSFDSVHSASTSYEITLAGKLYRVQKKFCSQEDPKIQAFTTAFFAKRINLHPRELETVKGALPFLQKHPLHNYFKFYNCTPQFTQNTLLLPSPKGTTSWEEWQGKIDSRISTSPPQSLLWYVGPEGVQEEDLYHWETLRPVAKLNASLWNNEYRIEICTCCVEEPRIAGDHSWIRLYTAEGEVYSIGKYRYQGKQNTLERSKGYLQCPDVSEFWNFPQIQTIHWTITEEQFQNVKAFCEQMQKQIRENENPPSYDPIENNCTSFGLEVLKQAGIEEERIPFVSITYLLLPSIGKDLVDWAQACHPIVQTAIKIAAFIPNLLITFGINLLQYFLNASCLLQKGPHQLPADHPRRFQGFFSLFSKKNAQMRHPYFLFPRGKQRENEVEKNQMFFKGFLPSPEAPSLEKEQIQLVS